MRAARLRAISEEVLRAVRTFLPPEVQLLDAVMGVPSRFPRVRKARVPQHLTEFCLDGAQHAVKAPALRALVHRGSVEGREREQVQHAAGDIFRSSRLDASHADEASICAGCVVHADILCELMHLLWGCA